MKKILKTICCIMLMLTFAVCTPLVELHTGLTFTSSTVYAASTKIAKPKISLKYVNHYSHIKISWKKCSGAQKYWVYRAEKGGKYKRIKVTTSTSFTDKSISYNKKYYYKVKAIGKNGKKSSFSNIKSGLIECDDFTYDYYFGVPDFGLLFSVDPYDIYTNDIGAIYYYWGDEILDNDYEFDDILPYYAYWLTNYGFDYLGDSYDEERNTIDYYYARNYDGVGVTVSFSLDGIEIYIIELE